MKILADENIARDVIVWLRSTGHDLLYSAEEQPGATDMSWAARSELEQRIILTMDKDFGELVYRDRLSSHGIVLPRLEDLNGPEILARLQSVWSVVEANPSGRFIVITENRVRVRLLPTAP